MLINLSDAQVAAMFRVLPDGGLDVDMSEVCERIAEVQDIPCQPRCALISADYLQDANGVPTEGTFTASGLWWVPDEHDEAIVGTWNVERLMLSITEEGLVDAPVSEDQSLLSRASRAVAETVNGTVDSNGFVEYVGDDASARRVAVAVVRDARVARPQDYLSSELAREFGRGRLEAASVLLVGDGKALVRHHRR